MSVPRMARDSWEVNASQNYTKHGGRPTESGWYERLSNYLMLLHSKDVVVSD